VIRPRLVVLAVVALVLLGAAPAQAADPPVVFVHGNGDTAATSATAAYNLAYHGASEEK
jgi:opacity protein-like surface antigen